MKARAAILARPPRDTEHRGDAVRPVLSFVLGEQRYGIDPRFVRAVVRTPNVTPLPQAPAFVRGMVALRGRIVAVVDLLAMWGCAAPVPDAATYLVVLDDVRSDLGLLAGSVLGISRIEKALLAPPAADCDARLHHVQGLTADGQIILDGAQLCTDSRFAPAGMEKA